ncbi:MAG TPA: hypothetical protein PL152_03385 [Steroidobacteraceae bacterium]|nr:hypothetical protein [Steroidobacteraceae bacterium]HQR48350.1 hypothetical protein [Steroidobacteraceae bacterium]
MEAVHPSNPPPGEHPEHPAIVAFVRTTLGCQCPDDVFRAVAVERVGARNGGIAHVRLTVGDRLLIYVFEPGQAGAAAEVVESLARTGIAERNARGFNRFRLVIATPNPRGFPGDAPATFAAVAGPDARAHLHFVATSGLPPALRSP